VEQKLYQGQVVQVKKHGANNTRVIFSDGHDDTVPTADLQDLPNTEQLPAEAEIIADATPSPQPDQSNEVQITTTEIPGDVVRTEENQPAPEQTTTLTTDEVPTTLPTDREMIPGRTVRRGVAPNLYIPPNRPTPEPRGTFPSHAKKH
jgi:hypothetical protein